MKSYSSINSKKLGKFLNSYKLRIIAKQVILKTAQKRCINHSNLNKLSRKNEFKESITNINKRL